MRSSNAAARCVGHRLAAREQHAQRGDVAALGRAVERVEHQDELRADRRQHGDAVARDRGAELRGVELRQQHAGCAEQGGRDVRGPDPEAERRGQRGEEDVALGEVGGVDREAVEVVPARLVVHHALGQPGGAGGRVQQEEIADGEAPLGERAALGVAAGACELASRSRPR